MNDPIPPCPTDAAPKSTDEARELLAERLGSHSQAHGYHTARGCIKAHREALDDAFEIAWRERETHKRRLEFYALGAMEGILAGGGRQFMSDDQITARSFMLAESMVKELEARCGR